VRKPLKRIGLGDLHAFAQHLIGEGLAPISRATSIASIRSLFGFLFRMRFIPVNLAAELPLPRYENRLAERVLSEGCVERLLAADTCPRDRILLNLLCLGGLRVSEANQTATRRLNLMSYII
jgi:integrase/recombinase XerD